MRKPFLLGILACGAALAQQPEIIRKVIDIKYADPNQVQHLVDLFEARSIRIGDGIAVRGSKESVDAVEAAIRKIDIPRPPAPNVELTVYMISAANQPDGALTLSSDLEPVTKQLHKVFAYKSYGLIDSFVVRTRAGEGSVAAGTLMLGRSPTKYEFRFRELTLAGEKEPTIRLNRMIFFTESNGRIETDLDMREGQKVVVGKASLSDSPLILVLAGKVVD